MPSLRKSLHNPRCSLEQVPSLASSALHGKGLPASHQTFQAQLPSWASQDSRIGTFHPRTNSHVLLNEESGQKTKAANGSKCHTNTDTQE